MVSSAIITSLTGTLYRLNLPFMKRIPLHHLIHDTPTPHTNKKKNLVYGSSVSAKSYLNFDDANPIVCRTQHQYMLP